MSTDLNVKREPAMERSRGGHWRKRSLQEQRPKSRKEFGHLGSSPKASVMWVGQRVTGDRVER